MNFQTSECYSEKLAEIDCNKWYKSFVDKIWEAESAVSGDKGFQKSWWKKIRLRVKVLTIMGLESVTIWLDNVVIEFQD